MKKSVSVLVSMVSCIGVMFTLFGSSGRARAQAQPQIRQSVERKFEQYRAAIKDAHKIDIKTFKDRIPGGHADGKPIVNYDLKQLLSGINFERDHTKDNMLALELAMDHLEIMPDYYTRLERMDWEYKAEKLRDM